MTTRRDRPAGGPPLLLGTAQVDITPRWPVPLAGFAARSGPFSEVAAPIRAAAFAFSTPGTRPVVLVTADLPWWAEPEVAELRDRTGLADRLVLHATHSHSGPQTTAGLLPTLGLLDPAYRADLLGRVAGAIGAATAAAEPVTVERHTGSCDLAVCRRHPVGDQVLHVPDPRPVDRTVTVLRFRSGPAVRALLVHYACHPTVNTTTALCGDYPGFAAGQLGRELGDGVVVGFLQGCCGDVNPGEPGGLAFARGGPAEARAAADRLVAAVRAATATPPTSVGVPRVEVAASAVELPLDRPSIPELHALATRADAAGTWARLLLAEPDRRDRPVTLALTRLRLAGDLTLLGFGAEPTGGYGVAVRQAGGAGVLPIGYTNGDFGYLVTAAELAAGGYEADESCWHYALPGRLAPGAEAVVRDAVGRLVGS